MSRLLLLWIAACFVGLSGGCDGCGAEPKRQPPAASQAKAEPKAALAPDPVEEPTQAEGATAAARPLEGPAWRVACARGELSLSGRVHPEGGVLALSLSKSGGTPREWSNTQQLALFLDWEEHIFAFSPVPEADLGGSGFVYVWAVPKTFRRDADTGKVMFNSRVTAARFDRQDLYEEWTLACTAEIEGGT